MARVIVGRDGVRIGRLTVTLQRTLRLPDDGRAYPLPPTLGRFPVFRVSRYAARLPPAWRELGGVFIPMYQREALWLAFDRPDWRPCAVQVAVGGIDAISGTAWDDDLIAAPQNYIVCPDQPWLDGVNSEHGIVRQFVATPLGAGRTIEGQLSGVERMGGIQLRVHEPRPGRFPERAPRRRHAEFEGGWLSSARAGGAMGIAAGGRMRQKIYPDAYGIDSWESDATPLFIHILNSAQFEQVTNEPPPPTPVDAAAYTAHGLPWFDLLDEDAPHLEPGASLSDVRGLHELERAHHPDARSPSDHPVVIDESRVRRIRRPNTKR